VTSFRFRPRYRALAIGAIGLGALIALAGVLAGRDFRTFSLVAGAVGASLGVLYLLSPAWKIVVHVDDDAIEVTSKGERRFRLPWSEVEAVVASPSTKTCFVNGGAPERSLLVPGPGAPAPYEIENRGPLFDAIVAHVGKDRIREVTLLESAPA
jgi:hypothetical protein